jgi:hypothetical protein
MPVSLLLLPFLLLGEGLVEIWHDKVTPAWTVIRIKRSSFIKLIISRTVSKCRHY